MARAVPASAGKHDSMTISSRVTSYGAPRVNRQHRRDRVRRAARAADTRIGLTLADQLADRDVTGGPFLPLQPDQHMRGVGMRWIIGANLIFALWCVGAIAVDGPSAIGATLLAVAAVSSAGTSWLERRLSR